MARVETDDLRPLADLEFPTETELEAPPRRFGFWAKAAGVACSMALVGGVSMLFKGGPVKGDVRGAVGFALVGHNTGEAEAQCLAVGSSMAAYKDAMAFQGETAYIDMGKAAQTELVKSGYT